MSGTITERLALIIDAKTDGAVSSIHRLSLEEQYAAERATVLEAKMADLNARMARSATGGTNLQRLQLSKLNSEYQGLTSTLATVPGKMGRVESAMSKVGLGGLVPSGTLGAVGKAAPGLLAGAAAFGGFEFIKSGVNDYVNLADAIRKVAYASGASVPDASKIVAITHALGVESDSAALGLFRLGKNIALQPQHLTAYGIAIAHTSNGNTDLVGTLENVATAYQNTTDPARRAAIVYEAFGRAGTTMLPILNATKTQLEDITKEASNQGRIFTQKDLDSAKAYQIEIREMETAFQSLALQAGRSLLPALTAVTGALTKVTDTGTSVLHSRAVGILKYTPLDPAAPYFWAQKIFGFGGGHHASGPQPLTPAQAQAQAQQAALSQTIAGTFAGAFDTLAGPQNVKTAKQTLAQARQALTDAQATRAKALRDLSTTQAGGPTAGATQLEAAHQRIIAAEANLKTAEYLGGDARIASARSSLASAQASLNKLRQSGATDTNKLADATDRLRRANEAVAKQKKAVDAAQKGVNDATGLSAQEIFKRITGQAHNAQRNAQADVRLARFGLVPEVIAEIDKLDQQLPGTLQKTAATMRKGLVSGINREFTQRNVAQGIAESVSTPGLYTAAGKKAGTAFVQGFAGIIQNGLAGALPGITHPGRGSRGAAPSLGGLLGQGLPGITVHGGLHVSTDNADKLGTAIQRHRRVRNLGSPVTVPHGA